MRNDGGRKAGMSVRKPPRPPEGEVWPPEVQSPAAARRLVFARDAGVCVDCGEIRAFDGGWHVDHNIPLWKVPLGDYDKRIWYWTLPNLVTRCIGCHKLKSKREEAEQAHHDRLAKKRAGKAARQRLTRTISGKIKDTRRRLPW